MIYFFFFFMQELVCFTSCSFVTAYIFSSSCSCSVPSSPASFFRSHSSSARAMAFQMQTKKKENKKNTNISMHILHTVLYRFPVVLTRRICLMIKSILSFFHFLYSHHLTVSIRDETVGRNLILITLKAN